MDASEGGSLNKVPVSTFFKNAVSDFPDEPSVAVSDAFVMFDQSTSTARTATFAPFPTNFFIPPILEIASIVFLK